MPVEPITREQIETMLDKARTYRLRAYAPYSGFQVGAALLTRSGTLYGGCNVENSSHPAGRCAEQTAVQKAVSEGEQEFVAIATVAEGPDVCLPCGVCRQVLSEFAPDLWIVMSNMAGDVEVVPLSELMPRPFVLRDSPGATEE